MYLKLGNKREKKCKKKYGKKMKNVLKRKELIMK
jgi:hypothetical protein